jgi:hypothetical protein
MPGFFFFSLYIIEAALILKIGSFSIQSLAIRERTLPWTGLLCWRKFWRIDDTAAQGRTAAFHSLIPQLKWFIITNRSKVY